MARFAVDDRGHPLPDGSCHDVRCLVRRVDEAFERITTDPDLLDGVPCVRGLRVPVATVVGMVADGMTVEEIVADFPYLEPEDVTEALRYAAEAVRERELPLRPAG